MRNDISSAYSSSLPRIRTSLNSRWCVPELEDEAARMLLHLKRRDRTCFDDASLVPTTKKPFDMLAEGLLFLK